MSRAPLLDMQGIDISFGGVPALRGANLTVAAGEVHALIGQNGAGKSTMIKILTGAYRRSGGSVRFEGREIDFRTPKEAREAGISTIYQEINLVQFRSVAENIFLGREPRRLGLIDWREVQRRASVLLESFGLQIDVKKPAGSYSTAIQQMVALARAVDAHGRIALAEAALVRDRAHQQNSTCLARHAGQPGPRRRCRVDQAATFAASAGAEFDHEIRAFDHGRIVFDYHHGVPEVAQALQDAEQAARVRGVETNRRLIERVQGPDQQ